jgi:RNA polymerase sigma factor (sigma-70 family)
MNMTDQQLLEDYRVNGANDAFAALVNRHLNLVYSAALRQVRDPEMAQDIAQAVFIVLVSKAETLTSRRILGDWLHGVAHRTALKARSAAFHRREKERAAARTEAPPLEQRNDWLPLLDQELARLPEKYRLPIVLCDLEGRTRQEAAQQLGWPEGTVAGRLTRGREMLAKRLLRRVSALSGIAGVLTAATANAALPGRLTASALQAALNQRSLSAQTLRLAQGVLQSMSWNKLKVGIVALLMALTAVGGLT